MCFIFYAVHIRVCHLSSLADSNLILSLLLYFCVVLAWAIGNEPNKEDIKKLPSYFSMAEDLASIRDQECNATATQNRSAGAPTQHCWHPITIPIADQPEFRSGLLSFLLFFDSTYPKAVDVWSFNLYRGGSFGRFFQDYMQFVQFSQTSKPVLISEFGPPSHST